MRFESQIKSAGFSEQKQLKLRNARVLIVGAGGLGCPAMQFLAAAGVGYIGIVDGDKISASNLNRQILYGEKDIGKPKARRAREIIEEKYSDILTEVYTQFLNVKNALQIISKYDVVLDCTDNFSSRYLINDACVIMKKPLVFGAIFQHEGQVMVFDPLSSPALNYRHVYPTPPGKDEIPDCNQTGVLGILTGTIGVLMATEAIKLITEFGDTLVNKILFYRLLHHTFYEMKITEHPEAEKYLPTGVREFLNTDYSLQCGIDNVIDWEKLMTSGMLTTKGAVLIDVREYDEVPKLDDLLVTQLPMSQIDEQHTIITESDTVFIFCQSGYRSAKAVSILTKLYPNKFFYSIKGGISDPASPTNYEYYAKT